jgi:hypothetical protein
MSAKQSDLPLVSSRSPTHARARKARHEPAPLDAIIVGKLLKTLELELAHRVICERTGRELPAERADTLMSAAEKARSRGDRLAAMITDFGGSPPSRDEAELSSLPWQPDDLATTPDEDSLRALLHQQCTHIVNAYRDAARTAGAPEPLAAELSRIADELDA